LTLLERTIADADQRLVFLAPRNADVPEVFHQVLGATRVHARLLQDVQQLRGRVYLEDGAVDAGELCPKGLHKTQEDHLSWHIASLNAVGEVVACAWYRLYDPDVSFHDLRVEQSPIAGSPMWRDRLWHAIETDLMRARSEGLGYAELGGWAIDKANRGSSEILLLACAAYSLSRVLGGALGVATATVRHSSSKILRRLGGAPVKVGGDPAEVPPYFDPKYGCTMELLRFDSRTPHPDLNFGISLMRQKLGVIPVLLDGDPAMQRVARSVPARTDSQVPQYAA
jgi:hypothetical protein